MQIPAVIYAGDSATWSDPATTDGTGTTIDSSWTLAYNLRGAGATLDVAATAKGTGWTATITAAQSAALNTGATPATLWWSAVATKGSARVTVGTGRLLVRPNLSALAAVFDGSTQAEKDLAAVRTEMSARLAGGATLEYTIGSRSLKKEPMAALIAMEQRLLRLIKRERSASSAANQLGKPGRLGVRFT